MFYGECTATPRSRYIQNNICVSLLCTSLRATLQVLCTVEVNLTFDHGQLYRRVRAEGMFAEDHNVRILSGFETADTVVDFALLRRIDGDPFQGVVVRDFTRFHIVKSAGRFLIQA